MAGTTTKSTLKLTFIDTEASKESYTINNAKQSLTTNQITDVMDAMIESYAFLTTGGTLAGRSGARLSTSSTTDYNVI